MKTSPNDVIWHHWGLGMFLFLIFFFYLFLPPQQCRPRHHHSPLTSHLPTSHQNHKNEPKQCPMTLFGLRYVPFFEFFFYLFLPSQQRRTRRPRRHHSPFTSHSPTSHQQPKTSPNNVQKCYLGYKYVFSFVFFYYLFLPPQQCRPRRHHSPLTSYSPKSHQKHKTSPNDVQWCCLGYKYVFFLYFFFTYSFLFLLVLLLPCIKGALFIIHG